MNLDNRRPLQLDPAAPFAIKRNVHEFEIDADAETFANAFAATMQHENRFARICIKRSPERAGKPFELGERFMGVFELVGWPWLEDRLFSDAAEITELEPRRVTYQYLEGSPIAGSSSYAIESAGPGRTRLVNTFVFQEQGGFAITALHRFGVRAHDEVVRAQVEAAAKRVNARVLDSTMRA